MKLTIVVTYFLGWLWKKIVTQKKKISENTLMSFLLIFLFMGLSILLMVKLQFLRSNKLWWMVVLCGSIYASQKLIVTTWIRWQNNPVFLSFKQVPMHTWEIPFPAVTVCTGQMINRSKYDLMSEAQYYYHNPSLFEDNTFRDIFYFCRQKKLIGYNDDHYLDVSSLNLFNEVAPTIQDVFSNCLWSLTSEYNCTQLMSPIFANDGICFSFNMLDKNDLIHGTINWPKNFMTHNNLSQWSIENHYHSIPKRSVYPRRADSVIDFLKISTIKANNIDPQCRRFSAMGVYIHHPAELPFMSTPFISHDHHDTHTIKIKPEVTVSTNLENYDVQKRKCFYSTERKLRLFKIYTENNCKQECFFNISLEMCGCVPHYIPQMVHLSSARNSTYIRSCNCLPSCTSIVYNMVPTYRYQKTEPGTVKISFLKETFIAIERKELHGTVEFLANCGGILALFTGFSVLSLVEIIYYFSIRWLSKLWSQRWFCV